MDRFRFVGDKRKPLIFPLLKSWHRTLDKLEQVMRVPYVYGERTNVGILALAAVRLGHLPFEEYSCKKGYGRGQWKGRADLRLYKKEGGAYFDFEAKCPQITSIKSKNVTNLLVNELDSACEDLKVEDLSENSAGIVFLRFNKATKETFKSDIEDFWNRIRLRESYNCNFCTLHVCSSNWWEDWSEDCPGIVLVGRYK